MTAGGKGRRSGVDVAAIDKENTAGMMETYGFPIWFYPIFILVVVLFAVCTEWDPEFGRFNMVSTFLNIYSSQFTCKCN